MEDRDALQGPPECAFPAPRLEQNVYATAADPRGYLPVYEFLSSNGTPLMWDSEDGYVNWTSIRKAMGWSKKGEGRKLAIAKELEDVERTSPHVRRVRGGILKIQGTWIPKESALEAALTYCHPIRHELVPIFG
ncbi:transcription regulator HTH, apses-type DNA-binding domain-containing protein, partial [Hyaloraphidium curvatum]